LFNRFALRTAAGITLLASAACGTIINGSKQNVSFASTPGGATVFVDNQQMGVTPVSLSLSRKDHHDVRLTLPGYQPYEIKLTRGLSGWTFGNIIFGGVPGVVIDAITGGLYKLSPDQVEAALVSGTAMRSGDGLVVRVVLSADPSWEKIGQLEPVAGF
jgi:hypothetical protein